MTSSASTPGDAQQRQPHAPRRRSSSGCDLRAQIVRHGRAMRLVLIEQVVAERAAGRIEHHRDPIRRFLLDQLVQHVEHAEHRSGRLALGIAEGRQRVKGPVKIGGAVNQKQLTCVHANDEDDQEAGCGDGGAGALASSGAASRAGTSFCGGAGACGEALGGPAGAAGLPMPIRLWGCCASGRTSGPFCPQAGKAATQTTTSRPVKRMPPSIARRSSHPTRIRNGQGRARDCSAGT